MQSIITQVDELLVEALVRLGIEPETAISESGSYGMGSEYRCWLAYARQHAMRTLVADRDNIPYGIRCLAEEVVLSTSAIAVAMRHGLGAPFKRALGRAKHDLREHLGHLAEQGAVCES